MDELTTQLKVLNIDLPQLIKTSLLKIEELVKADALLEAEMVAQQLLRVDQENVQAMQLYGLVLFRMQKYAEAIETLEKAVKLDGENAETHNNLALCYLHTNRIEQALDRLQDAVSLDPNNHNFYNNAGIVLRAMGKPHAAANSFERALELNPSDVRTWENLGSLHGQEKELHDAIYCFQKSLELDPNNLSAKVDLAYAYHLLGEWDKAWPLYEARLEFWHKIGRHPGRFYEIYPPSRAWDGEASLEGKTICVYCEQGSGDMIQFIRFVPQLALKGATVLIDAPNDLKTLFEPFGTVRNSYDGQSYDYHCSILSLPYLLKIRPEQYLGEKPYLNASKILDMSDYKNFYRVGIVWAGNPGHPNDANRSCPLKHFRELMLPGVKLFSLQKEKSKRVYTSMPGVEVDFAAGCEDMKVVDMSEYLTDFQATASVIREMDLVITVDTSVLHLAGALGKPTWGLLAFNPDWRWTVDGSKTIWYSSVELFRQTKPGGWEEVLSKVKERLNENLLSHQRQQLS
jgi:tetratricopeptide (TPR) repeat protein